MKLKGRPSKNVEDATTPLRNIYYSLKGQLVDAKDTGEVTPQKRNTARRLGLSNSLADLQNQANKVEARKRTRFTPQSDYEVVKSLTRKKK